MPMGVLGGSELVGKRVWEKEGTCFEGRTGGSVHLKMNRMWSLTFKYFILYF